MILLCDLVDFDDVSLTALPEWNTRRNDNAITRVKPNGRDGRRRRGQHGVRVLIEFAADEAVHARRRWVSGDGETAITRRTGRWRAICLAV